MRRRLSSSHRCGEISVRDVAANRPDSPCSTGHDVARADCCEVCRYEFPGRTGQSIGEAQPFVSTTEDQLRAAIDTECVLLPPRRGVQGVAALLRANPGVHDTAALWAVAHGRVRPPMIHVVASAGLCDSSHSCTVFLLRLQPRVDAAMLHRWTHGVCHQCHHPSWISWWVTGSNLAQLRRAKGKDGFKNP